MRFDAKFTAVFAAGVLGVSLIGGTPAHAEAASSATSAQTTTTKTTKEPAAKKPVAPQPKVDTVQPGDSLSKIAEVEKTTWVRLYDANADIADPNIIHPGEKVTVPLADQKLPDRYGELTAEQVAAMPTVAAASAQAAPAVQPSGARVGGPNAYDWGQCTWYVKNMRPDIGGYWGNAGYSWIAEAQAAGFATGSAPRAGAVAVEAGHVAYVQSVSGGNVSISEMNYAGGVGQVHYRTVPANEFEYIY